MMNRLFAFVGLVALTACASSSAPRPETSDTPAESAAPPNSVEKPTPQAPEGRLDDTVKPLSYRLALTLVPAEKNFSGSVDIEVEFSRATDVFFMHGSLLEVDALTLTQGGATTTGSYEQVGESGVAQITLEKPVDPGAATLSISYKAPFNERLEGIYRVVDDDVAYAFSQFEATSARLAFPSFDEPRFKTPFDIEVTAAADDAVITTTPEVESTKTDDGMVRHRFQRTQPLPTYLIAFAVGPLDVVDYEPIPATAIRDRPIPLRGVATRGKGERLGYALRNTAILVTTLEDYFGIPYPYEKLDIIAAPRHPSTAMENVGAIIYREQVLLVDENSLASQRQIYFLVHSHELAHQWFGNLVTPVWWNDLWLNESFATWMGNRAAATARPKDSFGLRTLSDSMVTMGIDSLASTRRIREPITRDEEISSAVNVITYLKGGGVLAMFDSYLGDEAFRAGVRRHMERFAHDVADADDFLQSLAEGSNRPEVIPAFRSFLEQAGVPRLTVALSCDEDKGSLAVTQSRYKPLASAIDPESTWGVPFCFATWDKQGNRTDRCELLSESQQSVALDTCPEAVLPNARGAGYYYFDFAGSEREALVEHFAELDAGEQLAVYHSDRAALRAGEITLAEMMETIELTASAEAWQVQLAPAGFLGGLTDILPSMRKEIRSKIRELYAKKARRLGIRLRKTSDLAEEFLRPALVRLVALNTDYRGLRAKLRPVAERALNGNNRTDERPVVTTALRIFAEENGEDYLKRALKRLETERDVTTRVDLIAGMSSVPEEQLEQLFELILGDTLRVNESLRLVSQLFGTIKHRDRAMNWLMNNFDKVAVRFPAPYQPSLIRAGGRFCTQEGLEKLVAMGERAEKIPGAKRAYAQSRESVELCIALRDHMLESSKTATVKL